MTPPQIQRGERPVTIANGNVTAQWLPGDSTFGDRNRPFRAWQRERTAQSAQPLCGPSPPAERDCHVRRGSLNTGRGGRSPQRVRHRSVGKSRPHGQYLAPRGCKDECASTRLLRRQHGCSCRAASGSESAISRGGHRFPRREAGSRRDLFGPKSWRRRCCSSAATTNPSSR